jgi:PKD repeat protein|tara:strand:+ start:191 stop:523 length:333 start_codon:yes stop_codon:yes gene_type:complete
MITQNIAPVTINFTDTSSGDGLTYLWNFGDGGTSNLRNPSHTFQAGVWEVTLTVTNDNGQDQTSAVIVATEMAASGGGYGQQQQQQQDQQQQNPPAGWSAGDGPPPQFNI